MAKRKEQRYIIERVLEPGDLGDELIAEIVDLGLAKRVFAATIATEPFTVLTMRHGARIIAKHP